MHSNWSETQEKINKYLIEILAKIEWQYGENRAPFFFPPQYFINNKKYICIIKEDMGEESEYRFESDSPDELAQKILSEMKHFEP